MSTTWNWTDRCVGACKTKHNLIEDLVMVDTNILHNTLLILQLKGIFLIPNQWILY